MSAHEKVIKQIFTMLQEDGDRLTRLVDRLWHRGFLFNKSEVVRLGLSMLEEASLATIEDHARKLERLRPGPKKQMERIA